MASPIETERTGPRKRGKLQLLFLWWPYARGPSLYLGIGREIPGESIGQIVQKKKEKKRRKASATKFTGPTLLSLVACVQAPAEPNARDHTSSVASAAKTLVHWSSAPVVSEAFLLASEPTASGLTVA